LSLSQLAALRDGLAARLARLPGGSAADECWLALGAQLNRATAREALDATVRALFAGGAGGGLSAYAHEAFLAAASPHPHTATAVAPDPRLA